MNKIPVKFLQAIVALAGAAALGLMLWVPPHEGRNVGATLFEVYFKDPFLAYGYIGSLPFFWGLWQAFKTLGAIGRGEVFTPGTEKALRTIRYCALATAGVMLGAVVFVKLNAGSDDPAGFVMPGFLVIVASLAAAAAAFVLENIVRGRGRS